MMINISAAFGLDGDAVNYISIVVEVIFAIQMILSKLEI